MTYIYIYGIKHWLVIVIIGDTCIHNYVGMWGNIFSWVTQLKLSVHTIF